MKPPIALPKGIHSTVVTALAEDVGGGDITAALLEETAVSSPRVVTRVPATLAGMPWFDEVFRTLDPEVRVRWQHSDGDTLRAGDTLCILTGPT